MSPRLGVLSLESERKTVAKRVRCRRRQVGLVFAALVVASPVLGNTVPSYPLRNGTFSSYQGYSRPAGWALGREAGRARLTVDPIPRLPFQSTAVAVVRCETASQGYIFQDVELLDGRWRFRAQVSGTPGAKARLEVSGKVSLQTATVTVTGKWQTLEMIVPRVAGRLRVHLRFQTSGKADVRYRRARLDAIRLNGGPVRLKSGETLGGVVLGEKPTAAERFAVFELQRFLYRMTGQFPGLAGRDHVEAGRRLLIGTAASQEAVQPLEGLSAEAYVLHRGETASSLVGNSGLGTLYAVYEFLKLQGCRWVMPGDLGEVVPRRSALEPVVTRVFNPDYHLVRSVFTGFQQFFPQGGWIYINSDELCDWALRNRFNSVWTGGKTLEWGADRGHGWIQDSGHSWNAVVAPHGKYFEDHPEWYPLVRGRRMPRSDVSIRLPNQLCVSNQSLRDHTVKQIVQFFRDNPRSRMFPMNPMDGPNYNCECDQCRALDPPGFEWNQDFSGFPRFPNLRLPPLSDRYLNYVTHVAERVARVFPDRLLEFYNYASRVPPSREKTHPSVSIKFTYLSGREVNVSLRDPHDPLAAKERGWLKAWAESGTRHLTYYPYTDWEHPDAGIHWYSNVSDLLRTLKRDYRAVGMMGETHTTIQADPMWWAIYSRMLWDVDTDYRTVISKLCPLFYGPAGPQMTAFYLKMDQAVLHREGPRPAEYHPNRRSEYSLDELQTGRQLLQEAAEKVAGDERLLRRVDHAKFAHAILTLVRIRNGSHPSGRARSMAQQATADVTALQAKYTMMVRRQTSLFLAPRGDSQ
ncbi:MAG: DUF4838 domain-containing protein [Planctomycetota bacterium]|nr:DUF4838 domain-containing protein [Planctomycetota bacterium]